MFLVANKIDLERQRTVQEHGKTTLTEEVNTLLKKLGYRVANSNGEPSI